VTTAATVIAVLGPTGVGKTAVGVELARVLGVRVISCDSMQLYQGFPVLTNQPSAEERDAAPHALVGVIDPTETCSAAQYAALARPLIEEDLAGAGRALVVGGTGLYMRAALAPLAVAADADEAVRARLEERARVEGPETLHAELARLDPSAAAAIDPRNVRRVVRALEAMALTGRAWSGRDDLWSPVYSHPTVIVGLVLEREELYRRIDARAAVIVDGGAVDEVRRFRREPGEASTTPGGPGIRSAIGYPEICRYLYGSQSRQDTIDQIAGATRRYARRQLTWLRKVGDAVIIDVRDKHPHEVASEIAALAVSAAPQEEHHRR
jgi:tRNA dimethylallyltransferase